MAERRFITPGGERLIVLTEAEYDRLVEAAEDAEESAAVRRFHAELAAGEEELLPDAMVARLLEGESPIRVWRDHRGLSLRALAGRAGVSPGYLSEIESGVKSPSVKTLQALAAELGAELDDLLSPADTSGKAHPAKS